MFVLATLLEHLHERGERAAIIEVRGENLVHHSCRDIARRAHALAQGLVADGLAPGEPVGLFAPNGADWVVARLAIAAAGAVSVAIDDLAGPEEAGGIIQDAGLRRVLTIRAHVDDVRADSANAEQPAIVLMQDEPVADVPGARSWGELVRLGEGAALPLLDDDAPAMLVYTSGTTASPKSFVLRNRHLQVTVRAIGGFGLIGPGDRMLMPLPLHHIYPSVVGLLVPLSVGAAVLLPEAASGPAIIRALKRGEATVMIGVPRLYEAIISGLDAQARAKGRLAGVAYHRLLGLSVTFRQRFGVSPGRLLFRPVHARLGAKLRLLVSAGAKLDPEIIWKLEGLGFRTLSGYGLAETTSAFTGNIPGAQRIGSEGRVLVEGSRMRVAAPDSDGQPDGKAREQGEIQLAGPGVFEGYRNNPQANERAFTADGWFRTGDLGRIDADGYVYVTGRLKELIVLGGGKNVFPEELERHYGASPLLREVAIVERKGALAALVLPDFDAIRKSANASVADVVRVELASAAKTLPSHERLSGFALIREPLPRTRLGKYQRFQLPQLYEKALAGGERRAAAALSQADRELLANPRAAAAWKVLEQRYAGRGLALDADPQLDLGLDSLEWLSLGLELETAVGVRLAEHDVAGVSQVRDLLRLVAERAPGADMDEAARQRNLEEVEARWLSPLSGGERLAGAGLYWVNRALARALFSLRVTGLEHLPAEPPFVIVANHLSDLDPPLLGAALPLARMQRLYWSGDRGRLFGSALASRFCRIAHIFPVDERAPGATLAMAERVLARGHSLVWFPESWRSPDGRLQRFLPGIGRLLQRQPVPAVPAFIAGTFEAMPRERHWPRPHPVTITFGAPLDPRALAAGAAGADAELRITESLRAAVARLGGDAS